MQKYCWKDKEGKEHCHIFKSDSKYSHFESEGVKVEDDKPTRKYWQEKEWGEGEVKKVMEIGGFKLKE
jgi:hypothetical protein